MKGLARMSRGISLNEVMVVTTHKMKINRTIVNTKRTWPPNNVPDNCASKISFIAAKKYLIEPTERAPVDAAHGVPEAAPEPRHDGEGGETDGVVL